MSGMRRALRGRRGEAGVSTAEYAGVTAVVAAVIVAVVLTPIGPVVGSAVRSAFCLLNIAGGPCGDDPSAATPGTDPVDGTPIGSTGPDDGDQPAHEGRDPETGEVTDPGLVEGIPPSGSDHDPDGTTGPGGTGSGDPADGTPGGPGNRDGDAADPTGTQSDPINSRTGAFVTSYVDLEYPGVGPQLALLRSYNSGRTGEGALGRGWQHAYEARVERLAEDRLVFVTQDGTRAGFTRRDGRWEPDPGVRADLTEQDDGFETRRPDGAIHRFDADGRLTGVEDRTGASLTLSYEAGRLAAVTDDIDRTMTFAYDGDRLVGVTGPDGREVAFAYDRGLLTAVTLPGGAKLRYAYDDGRVSEVYDASGRLVVRNRYEGDRVVEQTDGAGEVSRFTWDERQGAATMFDNAGSAWTDIYRRGLLVRRIDPHGRYVTFTYDDDLNVVSVVDELGREATATYDAQGRVLTVAAPGQDVSQRYVYDDAGDLVEVVDAAGAATRLEHDDAGRLTAVVAPDGARTRIELGDDGLPTEVIDPNGASTTFSWTESGQLAAVTEPDGDVVFRGSYDAAGRLVALLDATDGETRFTYDALGNVLTATDQTGATTTIERDASGRVEARTDALGRTTTLSYDARGLLEEVTAPDGATTRYGYDAVGQLVERRAPLGDVYRYRYDAAGRLVSAELPTGGRIEHHWDAAGHPVRTDVPVEGGSRAVTRSYDELGRVTAVDYADDTPSVAYTYDEAGRLASMTDGHGEETYTYDAAGRLVEVRRGDEVQTWAYDEVGHVLERTTPSGARFSYDLAPDGTLRQLTSPEGIFAFEHDAAGRVTQLRNPNGTTETREYDPVGRVARQKVAGPDEVLERAYAYDEIGNLTAISGDLEATFAYDDLDQLVEECHDGACTTYTYDAHGNRTGEEGPGGALTYRYGPGDQLEAVSGPDGTIAFEHDEAGRMTRAGDASYRYDLAGRLVAATTPGGDTDYSYDGHGRRRTVEGPQGDTHLTWDPVAAWPLLAEIVTDDATTAPVWGPTGLLGTTGTDPMVTHVDPLGSVVAGTDADGALLGTNRYGAFGDVIASDGALDLPIGFTGELTDPASGSVHLRARDLDPGLGRFLTRDPAGPVVEDPFAASYLYVGNRPTVMTDPLGLWCIAGKNPDGSCRGSGVVNAVKDTVSDGLSTVGDGLATAGKWAWENRQTIGGFVVAGACVAGAVATAGVAGAVCLAGTGALFVDRSVTNFNRAGGIDGIRDGTFQTGDFFKTVGTDALITTALMIPGAGLTAAGGGQGLAAAGVTVPQRIFVGVNAELPSIVCNTFSCTPGLPEPGK